MKGGAAVAQTETETLVREVQVDATPETIFPFLTDPVQMTRWMGREATLDPRPGGIYRVDVTGTHVARGEFVEVSPPTRVVFTWGWEEAGNPVPPGSTTVEIDLVAEGDKTLVRLTHRDLPQATIDSHAHGWEHYLGRLATAGAGGDPGADPWMK
jgi:uncharacterized protein YndB with AHSA1/START domain